MIDWKTIENFLRQWSYFNDDENFVRKLWKKFSRLRKKGFKKDLPTLTSREFFMVILLLSNHAVFLVQFGINLHLWVFKKALVQISAFWKIHKCNSELIPNWTRNSTTICVQPWSVNVFSHMFINFQTRQFARQLCRLDQWKCFVWGTKLWMFVKEMYHV